MGPLKIWHSRRVRSVCRWISGRSHGKGYGSVGSRRYRRPYRSVNGFEWEASTIDASLVPVVSPLEPVVLDMLLDLPWVSAFEEADADARGFGPFLRSPLLPDVDEDARCDFDAALAAAFAASAAALDLLVWFAACL